jgi:glucose-6-phosphate dehydrogenase assembly protein OpcA
VEAPVNAEAISSDVRVDVTSIEKQLADLWRAEQGEEGSEAITKAALWNVVAHTWNADEHAHATEVLSRASASVPQRTIVVQADPRGAADISSWISANCHLIGGGRQVCSEEVTIKASGDRVHHVAPLVNALLLPDMPVAVWWVGDLPEEHPAYVDTLLAPADRLIVDSARFSSNADLELVSRIAAQTTTAPADLNWARIDEWRAATAAIFDPPAMREQLVSIALVRVTSGGDASFGAASEALLYVSWLSAQSGVDVAFELHTEGDAPGICHVEIHFKNGPVSSIRHERERNVVIASSGGTETAIDCVTRTSGRETEDLIVRLLKRPEADRVYLAALEAAQRLGAAK